MIRRIVAVLQSMLSSRSRILSSIEESRQFVLAGSSAIADPSLSGVFFHDVFVTEILRPKCGVEPCSRFAGPVSFGINLVCPGTEVRAADNVTIEYGTARAVVAIRQSPTDRSETKDTAASTIQGRAVPLTGQQRCRGAVWVDNQRPSNRVCSISNTSPLYRRDVRPHRESLVVSQMWRRSAAGRCRAWNKFVGQCARSQIAFVRYRTE